MVNMLDESVLNITRDLERNNMLENTIIFFSSDVRIILDIFFYVCDSLENFLFLFLKNGGDISDYQRNYPLRGGKTTVFEGGQRVRSFIYGRKLGAGRFVYDGMFHSVDLIPTLMSAALDEPVGKFILFGINF